MARILSANLFRLRKSRMFRAALLLTLLITAAGVLLGSDAGDTPESVSLADAPLAHMAGAAVTVLFIGTDNTQNTVRNKLIVGSRRREIYAANMLTSAIICCSVNSAWLIGGLAGVPMIGWWKMSPASAATYILISMLCSAAFGAVAALFAMMMRRRSAAIVSVFAAALTLLIAADAVYHRLSANKEALSATNIDGEIVFELIENPAYADGAQRAAFELALSVNPLGVSVALSNCDLDKPIVSITGTAFAAIFVCSLGAALFGRRDLL